MAAVIGEAGGGILAVGERDGQRRQNHASMSGNVGEDHNARLFH